MPTYRADPAGGVIPEKVTVPETVLDPLVGLMVIGPTTEAAGTTLSPLALSADILNQY